MARLSRIMGVALSCAALAASAQSAPSKEMTLDEFRHYIDVLHIKEADERGVRVQMKAQGGQLPPWWPAQVTDSMIASMLQVDIAALDYNYVKGCVSSPDIAVLTTMFATPEGQQYVAKMTGGMVEQEGKGVSPGDARESAVDHDTGLPAGALLKLTPAEKERVKVLLTGDAMDCMNSGYKKASIDITDARTKAVKAVVAEHRDELIDAKTKYEAAHPASSK